MENIIFTDTTEKVQKEYYPKPASDFIPDWYKEMDSYLTKTKIPDGNGKGTGTIKRCMPVFDAIVFGYIIVLPADVYVSQKLVDENGTKTVPYYEWASLDLVTFHPVEQAPTYPKRNNHVAYPKWTNPWAIETPKGYSVLFTQPFHRESPFTILDGVVDTDYYHAAVNFPFVLNDPFFEGFIPAGTPIAQIIPFKRDKWKMKIGDSTNLQNNENTLNKRITKMFDAYKDQFRQKKEYK